MHRSITSVAALLSAALLATSCSSGLSDTGATEGGEDDKTPVTLTMWSFFTDREKGVVDDRLAVFEEQYPWITVDHVGGQSDDVLLQAVRGGTAPDVALSQNSDAVSGYCSSGAFQDLGPQLEGAESASGILSATDAYTQYDGTRCALPVLADVYGLYYNTTMFQEAGITGPPQTWDELAEDAKKLTKRAPDGSIEVAGFVPFLDFFENNAATFTPGWDLTWYGEDGAAAMADDPQWAAMFAWQKELVDWYGYDDLQQYVSGLGAEFSTENPFQTGQLAMAVDGEWRVAFAAEGAPDLTYATAPMPSVTPDTYGAGQIAGTTVGIPKGSAHPEAAWLLAQYLATDTDNLVALTQELRNVPTTEDSLADPAIRGIEQFDTMLDIAADPDTESIPGTPAGAAPRELLTRFAQGWQAGSVPDLESGLADVAQQIDDQVEQAAGGNAP